MLKDFQRETAKRIIEIFRGDGSRDQEQKRVLLSDEVGLGKTIMARAVVNEVRKLRKDVQDDDYRIVYVCSNQNIIRQNIYKLVDKSDDVLRISDSRLSMQHLVLEERMAKLKATEESQNGEMRTLLVPITPATSFSVQGGSGSKNERALMYAHVRRMEVLMPYEKELRHMFQLQNYVSNKSWKNDVEWYEKRVVDAGEEYIQRMQDRLTEKVPQDILDELIRMASEDGWSNTEMIRVINRLRTIFAEISLDALEPDLVIMDEFQRFSNLISSDLATEETMIAHRFFFDSKIPYILLLSATPYKPYTTLEEINEQNCDEQYEDFMKLMRFLNNGKPKFNTVWEDYSRSLAHMESEGLDVLVAKKKAAEEKMYEVMCRTERLNEGLIQSVLEKEAVPISEGDILSYCQMQHLLDEAGDELGERPGNLSIEYVKSSPYLLSFMQHYKEKKFIEKAYDPTQRKHAPKPPIVNANSQRLLLKGHHVYTYKPIAPNNARLDYLSKELFSKQSELLLWVPASHPYYSVPATNVFAKNKDFSKVLVFSSWEMVPRMLAVMLSYESEQKNISEVFPGTSYKAKQGAQRLTDVVNKKDKHQLDQTLLMYPSSYLKNLYNPQALFEEGIRDLASLQKRIEEQIKTDVQGLDIDENAPAGSAGVLRIIKALEGEEVSEIPAITPRVIRVLAHMAIASPAVCLYRIFDDEEKANVVAKDFVSLFNIRESAAIVDRCSRLEDANYYERVLEYCVMGNLQSVLNEFAHTIEENTHHEEYAKRVSEAMMQSFVGVSTVDIDTTESFCKPKVEKYQEKMAMHRFYAYDYANGKVQSSDQSIQHNMSLQQAFNSPFRPFVLATTSVGQEGLDFHRYSRKIMHWNLPSNPVDMEQREGRINRYKCLAIRRNIAHLFPEQFTWHDMFEQAKEEWKQYGYSEMVPFWCLPREVVAAHKTDGVLEWIERIVPMYPMSLDQGRYQHLIDILSMYRLTMGQPRQEELLELLKGKITPEDMHKLLIDLSPYNKNNGSTS